LITWSQKNENNDILGYNIYKRREGEFFQRVNSELLSVRDNLYLDSSIDEDVEYIYAVESIDVHGNFSNLSVQYKAKITFQNYEIGRCEEFSTFHKHEGASIFFTDEEKKKEYKNLVFFNKKFSITPNPLYRLEGRDVFLFRIMSLDSTRVKEIKVNFSFDTIYHRSPDLPEGNISDNPGFTWNPELLRLLRFD
jgi:hypothetical protein